MGDTDDSSNAAQGAPLNGHGEDGEARHENGEAPQGLFRRIAGYFGTGDGEDGEDGSLTLHDSTQASHGLVNLSRMRVEDVAIPKADIVAVPETITREELIEVFRESGLTRLPVFDGTLDTPVGMAHLKDFALGHMLKASDEAFSLRSLLRPLLYVPPSMPIGVLLTKMQTERRHMALVIDEYGGVEGLVTIEDLIEQVIGEIEDEHDTEEGHWWTREKTGCYLALAKTPLEEFEAEIGMQLADHDDVDAEEIDTLGGLVFVLAGHVPARGEVVPHPAGLDLEVVDADPRRIKRLRVRRTGAPAVAAGGAIDSAPRAEAARG